MHRAREFLSAIASVLLASSAVSHSAPGGAAPVTSTRFDLPTAQAEDPHVAMRKLLGEIELRMRATDRLLSDAAAGGSRKADAAQVGSLLGRGHESAARIVEDIDRLLELAHHPHPPGGT